MLPRVLKYSGANFWDLKEDQVDFDEMKAAYLRASSQDVVLTLRDIADVRQNFGANSIFKACRQAADEIESLRLEIRELESEIQRLEKLANYGQ